MKCTDFFEKEKELKRTALRELAKAVKAHGGKYEWADEDGIPLDGSDMPCVCVFLDEEGPTDIIIHSVEHDENGYWTIEGETVDEFYSIEVTIEDPYDIANAYQIQSITENIPETDDVKDATVPQSQPVTWLSHDDLEQRDFDSTNITNEQLAQIASKMGDYYVDYSYWDDMEEACQYWDVPKKEQKESDEED